ncbi:S-methyl-5-thioribose kinase [Pelagibius litoralis]|uniref:S-methyl-5-thioribose kinase n=1 Tax=Pelagibius litoralis TaxID=374515 RepID=A0A967F0C1_9PROT|nr:S-methyl-5-thioribose kinase [Pelagibius litoralis]NIA70682.1 S-methyl-5-thioribose kinase [Pelagibius litoralis]
MADRGLPVPEGYAPKDDNSLPAYLAAVPAVAARLGGGPAGWRVREVGDGNLNLVFIVEGPAGGVAVKQALPYVRLVGESWPLPLSRAHFEQMALATQAKHAPGLVPAVLHYDETLALIVMELLHPHIIMRQGMIKAVRYPGFVNTITDFMARTLFHTSDLALPAAEKKAAIAAFCGNTALCKITEDLIFTEPYMVAENNRWTTPQLDNIAKEIREDGDLKVAVSRLKLKFLSEAQALLHGDLHTGSVMVTQDDTRVIDPEFAFYGPMGFDIGAVIANLLINYFSQDGHATPDDPRGAYQTWVLDCVEGCWNDFRGKFVALWQNGAAGDAYPPALFADAAGTEALKAEQEAYMDRLFQDSLSFAAAKMIRRILGLAHNIDLEWIEDADVRAACETRCLKLARDLMVNTANYRSIEGVTAAARAMRNGN